MIYRGSVDRERTKWMIIQNRIRFSKTILASSLFNTIFGSLLTLFALFYTARGYYSVTSKRLMKNRSEWTRRKLKKRLSDDTRPSPLVMLWSSVHTSESTLESWYFKSWIVSSLWWTFIFNLFPVEKYSWQSASTQIIQWFLAESALIERMRRRFCLESADWKYVFGALSTW